jgi:hypothetical protein
MVSAPAINRSSFIYGAGGQRWTAARAVTKSLQKIDHEARAGAKAAEQAARGLRRITLHVVKKC